MHRLGIDIGGSGIKAAVVDTSDGSLVTERRRVKTPRARTPEAIATAVGELFRTFDSDGPVGVSFPAVVVDGEVRTAGNLDASWRRTDGAGLLRSATGRDCVLLNDADAAAIAEVRLGAGRGLAGKVIVVTIGTGLGSGVVQDGVLIPNFEFGRMLGHDGEPVEFFAGDRARKRDGLGWKEWGRRFDYFLARLARVAAPDHIILGGGASKKFAKFRDVLTIDVPIRVATFRNNAGIVGAALAASPPAADTS